MTPRFTPVRIAIVYAVLGAVWIIALDRAVEWLLADQPATLATHTARGLLYIAVTTVLVYWLARGARASGTHEAEADRARADLRDARALRSALVDASPLPLFTLDRSGRILTWNESAERVFGWSAGEVVGAVLPIVPPEEEDVFSELLHRVLAGAALSGVEVTRRRKDGTPIELRVSTAPVRDGDAVVAAMAVVEDVTEHKRTKEALERSERRFRSVVESTPDAILVQTAGRFAFVNPACVRMLGAESAEDLLERPVLDRVHPDDRPDVEERIRILHEERRAVKDRRRVVLALDGREIHVEASAAPIRYEDQEGALVFLRDVSERHRREAERDRLLRAVSQAGEAIIITDPDGTIEYVNPAFEQITGFSHEEAVGENPRIQKSDEHDEAFYRQMWQTLRRGETWTGRIVNRRKDGTAYTADASISPVRDASGEIVNHVAVERDVTREMELENQLLQAQKIESIGSLAGGIAHDFNNMLTVILGNLEMALEATPADDPRRKDLEEVRSAARRSSELVGQLLGFARKQIIAPRALDLNAAVEARLGMLRRLIGEDLDLRWRPAEELWTVHLDPAQLDQILTNLVVNARDAIEGVGQVTIETGNVEFDEEYCAVHGDFLPGEYVMLAISDTGRGMDRERVERIFEPFYTTKPQGRGTGLGLSTVYGIVKQNEGFINVYSELGEGTTFRIYLSRLVEEGVPDRADVATAEDRGGAETVLVVEDETAILKVAARQLESLGYAVLTASDPDEAIRIADAHEGPIHVLFTDVVLPNMNGRDLYEGLLASRSNLKCLFMSGYTADAIAHRGVLEEGVHFLQKPFTIRDLAVRVREVLEG